MNTLEHLKDPQLYHLCKKYGSLSLHYRQKFAGLLPEVERRKLYKSRGYVSIEEFAAKLCGMSAESVGKILRLHKVLQDKPLLREQLTSGSVGWSKLQAVAYIATPETDTLLAEKVDLLPKAALEAYVQGVRKKDCSGQETKETSNITPGGNSLPEKRALTMYLTEEVEKDLRLFKQKLEKEGKETLDWNAVLKTLLQRARGNEKPARTGAVNNAAPVRTKESLAARKEQVAKELPEMCDRYIPVKVRKLLAEEYHGMCAFSNCRKPAKVIHHTRRYTLYRNHDPRFLVPLCHDHHTIAHNGLIANEEEHPSTWHLRSTPDKTSPKYSIDRKVQRYTLQ